jgi:hypothetical protein
VRTKGIIILGLVAIVAIASIFATSRPARVAYHQWRLAAAIDNARTAGEGKLTAAQEFLALLRGSPATSAEYEEAWQHHEDALVNLNVLTRREFTLTKPVANTDRSRIITAAEREFGAGGPWSVTAALSNSHAVVITAPVAEMSRWEQLIYFYFGQDQRLTDEAAVIRATDNATRWLFERGYRNVLVEINNECNVRYDHEILQPKRMHELIERVRKVTRDNRRFYVGTSYGGGTIPLENVVRASDFLLIHDNGVSEPNRIAEMVRKTRVVPGYFRQADPLQRGRPLRF